MLHSADLPKALATKPRVLVTGGGGFIGSAIVERLSELDFPLSVVSGAPGDRINEPRAGVQSLRAEITAYGTLCEFAAGCEVVVHLAGPPSVRDSFEAPERYASVHIGGTATVLRLCRTLGIHRLIYLSSAEVYGRSSVQPVPETQTPSPRSPYAAAKLGAESMILAYANAFDLAVTILRPFSIYGPGQPDYALIPTIVRQALSCDAIVLSDLEPVRDYCAVGDLVDAVLLACHSESRGILTLNIGTGTGTSVAQLASTIAAQMDRQIPILTGAPKTRPGDADIYRLVADVRRAHEMLGWFPQTRLEAGLSAMIARMRT